MNKNSGRPPVKLPPNDIAHLRGVKRLGIVAGSFNPAHHGHMMMAMAAKKALNLDKICFMITPKNPWKKSDTYAPLHKRQAYLEKILQKEGLESSAYISIAEDYWHSTYTSEMVAHMVSTLATNVQCFFIMGDDVWQKFHRFKNSHGIMQQIPIVVMARKAYALWLSLSTWHYGLRYKSVRQMQAKVQCPAWTFINQPKVKQSSTALRQQSKKKWWL